MIKLTESNHNKSLFDVVRNFKFPNYAGLGSDIAFHNTPLNNVISISNEGLRADHKREVVEYQGDMLWFSMVPNLKGYGGVTIACDVSSNLKEKVNKDELVVYGDIKVEDILFFDIPILSDSLALQRLSDIRPLIEEYGRDKYLKVFKNRLSSSNFSLEEMEKILDMI